MPRIPISSTLDVSDGITAAEPVEGARVTANAFRTLRIAPFRGRDFRPGEDQAGAAPVAILGYGTFVRRYGGDPGVLGKTIRVNDAPATVIGVMPEGMRFPMAAELWMPLAETTESAARDARRARPSGDCATG